ncbi:hypothetical protein ACWKWC_00550 [Geodermatophilus nigrescens]
METWEYLLIRVQTSGNAQYVLEPYQRDLDANLQNVGDSHTVALFDELGRNGWELVSVDESGDGRYWMKRLVLAELDIPEIPHTAFGQ